MDLKRLSRLIAARWGIIVLLSVIGFASAYGLTEFAVGEAEPVFEGVINVEFELGDDETVEDLANQIQTERGVAALAAQDLLEEYDGSSIIPDTTAARLTFIARGSSAEEAEARVEDLADAYLNADPSSGGDVESKLSDLELQAAEIQAEIESLQPSLTAAERDLLREHRLLDLKIQGIENEIVGLTIADSGATGEQQGANAERMVALEGDLAALEAEKAALPPPPSEEPTATEQFRLESLNRMLDFLELEYQRFAMRSFGITSDSVAQPVTVRDLTPSPPSALANGLLGFIGGLALAVVALAVTALVRKEVWLTSDLELPVLGTVPPRRRLETAEEIWYDATDNDSRKESVQKLRTGIEGTIAPHESALAIVSDHVDPMDCQMLGLDVASAFASSGQTVLVVSADYSSSSELEEFSVGVPSLDRVVGTATDSMSTEQDNVTRALNEAFQVRPGLTLMSRGDVSGARADAFAGLQFRRFVELASSEYDIVIVVAGEADTASAHVIAQRVGNVVLAVQQGRSTVPSVDAATTALATQDVTVLGAVVVSTGSFRRFLPRFSLPAWARRERRSHQVHHPPSSRFPSLPHATYDGEPSGSANSLGDLVGDLSQRASHARSESRNVGEQADDLGGRVLLELGQVSRADSFEPVAAYVVGRVEDLLLAGPDSDWISRELATVVEREGFIPLTPVPGRSTAGEWLIEELCHELGDERGYRIAMEFAGILGGVGASSAESLNSWLRGEFFDRHLERTGGDPVIWHLTSHAGTFQVLASSRHVDPSRLNHSIAEALKNTVVELQGAIEVAGASQDMGDVAGLDSSLRDLLAMGDALEAIQTQGESGHASHLEQEAATESNGLEPVWTDEVLQNCARLQRFDLLARPILTDDEVASLTPTG
jgi:hypothetical protein